MATNLYLSPETPIVFSPSGSPCSFNVTSLPNGSGFLSSFLALGSSPHADWFEWRAVSRNNVPATVGNAIEIYVATASSSGVTVDGNLGAGPKSLTDVNRKRNLKWLGSLVVDSTANGDYYVTSGITQIVAPYVAVAWFNHTGQALSPSGADHAISFTPIPQSLVNV